MERHIHLYNSTEKEKERPAHLKDYFYRCFSEYPIGKSAREAEQKRDMGQGQTRGAGKGVHDILGQESEQRNQPSRPRARLEFMPGFSFLVPSADGRTAMEDSSLRQH